MPDVRGKRVLVFGDSLSASATSPGGVFAARLDAAGAAAVEVNARVGRSAASFYASEDATAELAAARAFGAELVVVWLGTNDCGRGAVLTERRMRELRDALAVDGAEVWAFGPPTLPARFAACSELVVATMRDIFAPRFIDARSLTPAGGRTADGVHFTGAGATALGDRLAETFLGRSSGGGWLELALALALVGGALALKGGAAVGV